MEEFSGMVAQIATEMKRQFPVVDRDDVAQELWLWMYAHPDKVEEWAENGKRGERSLATALRRFGRAWAIAERAHLMGYDVEDNYYYSTAQLRELLPVVMDRELWTEPGHADDTGKLSRTSRPNEGGNRLAMICDVRSGLETGSKSDKDLLWTHFGLALEEDEHALLLGITVETLRVRVTRAVQRLQRRLGGAKPESVVVGARRVLSNAQAQAITRNQESEE